MNNRMSLLSDIPVIQPVRSLADPDQLRLLYQQACDELAQLDPTLIELEAQLSSLRQQHDHLKQNKQRLLTIKLSLQGLVDAPNEPPALNKAPHPELINQDTLDSSQSINNMSINSLAQSEFSADMAFHEVNQRLRQRDSVNYEIYRAIVYQGGRANTDQIKQYLIEQRICQPGNGQGFEQVTLADISARVNYLVKKGLVLIENRGQFKCVFGWV